MHHLSASSTAMRGCVFVPMFACSHMGLTSLSQTMTCGTCQSHNMLFFLLYNSKRLACTYCGAFMQCNCILKACMPLFACVRSGTYMLLSKTATCSYYIIQYTHQRVKCCLPPKSLRPLLATVNQRCADSSCSDHLLKLPSCAGV